jgi:hypothetical protein
MKLSDLFENNDTSGPIIAYFDTVDKLFERILPNIDAPNEQDGIPDFNPDYTSEAGSFNQKLIYSSYYFGGNYQTFVIFNDEKEAISFVVLQIKPELVNNTERTKVVRSWTREDSRRNGLVVSIYQFLVKKLELKLISDTELTQNSLEVYKSFINKGNLFDKISFYNEKTREIQDEIPDSIWIKNNHWRIMLEEFEYNYGKKSQLNGIPKYRVLSELIYCLEGTD